MSDLRSKLIRLAYQQPELRKDILPLLRQAVEEESEGGGKKKGPPPGWQAFLDDKYDGGKKKVPNPNSETRQKFPQVAISTAMEYDTVKSKLHTEFNQWRKENKDKIKGKADEKPKADDKDESKSKEKDQFEKDSKIAAELHSHIWGLTRPEVSSILDATETRGTEAWGGYHRENFKRLKQDYGKMSSWYQENTGKKLPDFPSEMDVVMERKALTTTIDKARKVLHNLSKTDMSTWTYKN